jgi:flagellar biosynthesis/type III secretory pathway protein FliH
MKSQCIALSLRVSEEVLGERIAELSDATAARIERALAELSTAQLARIEVHPSEYAAVQRRLGKAMLQMSCELVRVETIAPGSARLVTIGGSVVVDWRDHLDHLKSEILRALHTRPGANEHA